MATADQIRAAAAGYQSLDDAAAKRLREAQALVFGQAAQQVGSTRQAQAVAPALVQGADESELKAAQQTADTQVQAGELANQAEQQAGQQRLEAQATAQGLQQTQQAAAQQVAEATAEAAQRKQMTADEQASASRMQQVGLDYDGQLAFMSRRQREDLARLGRDVKDKLFTDRLAFERDEVGRKFSNERQLADYTRANAKSDDELRDKVQQVQQAHANKEYMIDRAYQIAFQRLEQEMARAEQEKDQASQARLADIASRLKKEEVERQKKAGVMGNVIGGAVSGAATGTAILPGWGTLIGGVIGAGAGLLASQ
jgi:hypothetical protein